MKPVDVAINYLYYGLSAEYWIFNKGFSMALYIMYDEEYVYEFYGILDRYRTTGAWVG